MLSFNRANVDTQAVTIKIPGTNSSFLSENTFNKLNPNAGKFMVRTVVDAVSVAFEVRRAQGFFNTPELWCVTVVLGIIK